MSARPWKVFVFDIGPTMSFATEAAAMRRAHRSVTDDCYSRVSVYNARQGLPMRRKVVSYLDETPIEQEFDGVRWVPVIPALAAVASR